MQNRGRACLCGPSLPPRGHLQPAPGTSSYRPLRRRIAIGRSAHVLAPCVHFTLLSGGGIPGTAEGGRLILLGFVLAAWEAIFASTCSCVNQPSWV